MDITGELHGIIMSMHVVYSLILPTFHKVIHTSFHDLMGSLSVQEIFKVFRQTSDLRKSIFQQEGYGTMHLIQDQMRLATTGHQHMFHILYHGVITAPPKITGLDMIPAIDIEDFPFVEYSKMTSLSVQIINCWQPKSILT